MTTRFRLPAPAAIALAIALLTTPAAATLASGTDAVGATIGGTLYRQTGLGRVPAIGVPVQLNSLQRGLSATIYTDSHGYYEFQDVPAGEYYLRVVVSERLVLRTNLLSFPDSGTFRLGDIQVPEGRPR
ncbi:MAG TPA: SdrD B-like domain-containing protein [Longimicrobiaceae bacterium]|nr:SdrD B-like domain-containing protein [Longimicrobiaceae bacterium]